MNSNIPIRSRAAEEGGFEIPLWGVPFVLLVLFVCLFSGLGALGLVGPDEPRYAAIARAMAETHDWVTPRLWGTPWFEKPVLYYWAAGIAMRIFGVGEFAARLPSALAALLAVVAVTWTALRSYGIRAAWYTLLLLPASVAMIGFARAASPDMLFAGCLAAALAVASEMLQKPRPGSVSRIAFGFFLGAAVLAKGPAAVILAGGATLLWAGLARRWLAAFRFLHPLVLAAFCATALPWYVLCALRNPDFLRVFLWQHNFERYLTPMFQHPQPFWFYIPVFLLALFPWCVPALGLIGTSWNKEGWRDSPALFALSWSVLPVVFFSFSQSKLPGYILPAIPPAFLFLGPAIGRAAHVNRRWFAIWTGITGAVFAALAIAVVGSLGKSNALTDFGGSPVFALLFLAATGGLIVVCLSAANRPSTAFATVVLLVPALVIITNIGVLPTAESRLSARNVARYSLRLLPPRADVSVYGLTRNWTYGLNYYFGRELPEWNPGAPLPEWLFTSESNAIGLVARGARMDGLDNIAVPEIVLVHAPEPADRSNPQRLP